MSRRYRYLRSRKQRTDYSWRFGTVYEIVRIDNQPVTSRWWAITRREDVLLVLGTAVSPAALRRRLRRRLPRYVEGRC